MLHLDRIRTVFNKEVTELQYVTNCFWIITEYNLLYGIYIYIQTNTNQLNDAAPILVDP